MASTPPADLVSVVLTTRDRSSYLEAALASVLQQTHGELEVIVVDDGSVDSTPEVLEKAAQRDSRVAVIRHDESKGAQAARNAGIARARGPIVAFLDDDCTWLADKTERQLTALTPEHGLVYCRHAIRHGGEWVVEGEAPTSPDSAQGLLRRNHIGTYAILVRRELLQRVGGFDEAMPRLQDWDLLLRLARHTAFAWVPEVLVRGEQLSTGITMDTEALGVAADRMIEGHGPHLSRRQQAGLHYGLAKYLLVDGRTGRARRFFARALRLDPLAPAHWAGLAAALLGPAPARWIRGARRRRRAPAGGETP